MTDAPTPAGARAAAAEGIKTVDFAKLAEALDGIAYRFRQKLPWIKNPANIEILNYEIKHLTDAAWALLHAKTLIDAAQADACESAANTEHALHQLEQATKHCAPSPPSAREERMRSALKQALAQWRMYAEMEPGVDLLKDDTPEASLYRQYAALERAP